MMFVGIDAVEKERIEKFINNPKCLEKYFTKYEIGYANQTINRAQRFGGIFAAKEAFLKALELGIGGNINLSDICVKHKKNGCPYISLSDNAQKFVKLLNITKINLSITHTTTTSIAICICN